MALQKCHECGHDVSSEAKSCPNCGAIVKPPECITKQPYKPGGGCLIVFLCFFAFIFLIAFAQMCEESQKLRKSQLEGEKLVAELHKHDEENEKTAFITNVEKNYKELLNYYKDKDIGHATSVINDFKKYGKMDYKDVATLEKKISEPKYIKEAEREVAKENKLYMIKKREEIAKQMESHYLNNGMDVKISLSGPEKTSMRLEYVLFSRPEPIAKLDFRRKLRPRKVQS